MDGSEMDQKQTKVCTDAILFVYLYDKYEGH